MDDLSIVLRNWRRATGLKQSALAVLLGVSQATVSRWENGLDEPTAAVYAKLRSLVDEQSHTKLRIEAGIIEKQPGVRALVDWDGMTLLATTPTYKLIWPEIVAAEGQRLADHLVDQSRDLFHDDAISQAVRREEIAMIAGVSDRHLNGFNNLTFRHYWAVTPKKIGTRHLAEISFEACEPDAELGLRHILRLDEIG